MTLKGVMAVVFRYFIEFAYLPGVLRKSSRSLSHPLTSSCMQCACAPEATKFGEITHNKGIAPFNVIQDDRF